MLYKYFAFAKNHLEINNHDNGEPRTIKVMKYEKVQKLIMYKNQHILLSKLYNNIENNYVFF